MKVDPIEAALAQLDHVPLHTPDGQKQIAKALSGKYNLVAAKAARIVGDALWPELTTDLAAAFGRFIARGAAGDKGCAATIAVARALFNLDHDDADVYLKGMRHVQMEPVWGGSVDTAAELRAICAMGLANTRYPGKLRALVDLLADREWQARAGAVRALAVAGSEAALLLLRFKALSGDREPEVIADCFTGLLSAEGADAVPFVASFADSKDKEVKDAAILALGASRRADAIEWMMQRFHAVADMETRKSILLSLATSRTEAAVFFVLGQIREGSAQISDFAVSAMEVNRGDEQIQARIDEALSERSNKAGRIK
jgi:HEAT repeat protein